MGWKGLKALRKERIYQKNDGGREVSTGCRIPEFMMLMGRPGTGDSYVFLGAKAAGIVPGFHWVCTA
jgi:hypothetical protein